MIVTLTARTDYTPVPRVEIRFEESTTVDGGAPGSAGESPVDGGGVSAPSTGFDGGGVNQRAIELPYGTERISLLRTSQRRKMLARGWVDRTYRGLTWMQDFEVGHDVTSAYALECWSGSELLGEVQLGSIEVPWTGDPDGVVVQQPLNPRLNFTALNLEGSWPTITREAAGQTLLREGASYPTLIGMGPRQGAKGVSLDFGVESREQAEAVWRTLGDEANPQLPVWLVRAHQATLPRVFFCHVKSLSELEARNDDEWSRFQAVVDEIEPPAPGLIVPAVRYSDLAVSFGTYSGISAALPKYSSWSSAWDYSGAAG